ncbi:L-gulono-1,4-lactone dehydrogenase [Streptomyces sp. RB5]|uniref:L-gulono-1,4-lactone dehydrogenase n=1 Tax=Streptomyces smaragdinus TaxID=2585196 RepID=A0A7K0C984_9ACTN|nr:D-arabinono-1,4-lactone oxidase [Streptomyces smaragdinus]MQY09956.1 L-gulono-1,4-lactone dehydrogenase [Streptomyces smaragdinus]
MGSRRPAGADVSADGTWTNFSRRHSVRPQRFAVPHDLDDLRRVLREATAEGSRVRVVGSGHSYNDVATAPDTQVSLRRLNRIRHVDPGSGHVTVEGGASLREIRTELARHGLAFDNMGDIDHQSIAGALSTGTHGTGLTAPAFASQVVAMELMLADGSLVRCSAEDPDPALFDAARVSLGALGVIVAVTLRAVPAYHLRRTDSVITRDQALALLEDPPQNGHIGFYFMPYIDQVLMWTAERTTDPVDKPSALGEWFRDVVKVNHGLRAMGAVARRAPRLVPALSRAFARGIRPETTVDTYDKVFLRPLFVRHDAFEFAVEQAEGPGCVRTLMAAVEDARVPAAFPCETRVAPAESAWLHPQYGRTTTWVGAAIQSPGIDVDGAWEEAQRACVAKGGRPHWGKWHTLTAAELGGLYPRWDEFTALRTKLDPGGLFGSPAIDRLLGRAQ